MIVRYWRAQAHHPRAVQELELLKADDSDNGSKSTEKLGANPAGELKYGGAPSAKVQ